MLYKFKVNNEDMSRESFIFLNIIALDQGPTATWTKALQLLCNQMQPQHLFWYIAQIRGFSIKVSVCLLLY